MTRVLKLFLAAVALGFLAASTLVALAEDTSHEEHHPAVPAAQEPQAPKAVAVPDADAPADAKMPMPGGMMGGDQMPMMIKMMKEMHGMMMGCKMQMMPRGDAGPSSMAFNGIMNKMHNDMAITYTGNSDVDFVKGMIPHHQAAVDMAKTVLLFGKDPNVKKVAEGVIKAQEAEIIWLKEWLKKQDQ